MCVSERGRIALRRTSIRDLQFAIDARTGTMRDFVVKSSTQASRLMRHQT
jgi:hypothetical protein